MPILTIVLMCLQLLPQILQATGVITPVMAKLMADLSAAIPGLISGLVTGKQDTDKALAVLQAFQAEIVTLQKDTRLDPAALMLASSLNAAITEALAAYGKATEVCDPSTLTPLPETL